MTSGQSVAADSAREEEDHCSCREMVYGSSSMLPEKS